MKRRLLLYILLAASCASPDWREWGTHKDPLGFSVQLPPGWRVVADSKSGRVDLQGPQAEIIIWPVFVPGTLNRRSSGPVLRQLTDSSGFRAEWGAAEPAGPTTVRVIGRAANRAAVSALTWIPSSKGTAGYLYIAAAPLASWRQSEDSFARILASFRITGTPGGSAPPVAAPQLRYVRWRDPKEDAFSLEVPANWRASGGLFRFAPVDTRSAWEVTSPDGIHITGGDADLPTFTEPNQMLSMTGFHEGAWYSPGYGVRMLVRRYQPGTYFAREYIGMKIGRSCQGLNVTDSRERADAVAAINAINSQLGGMGMSIRTTAGEVAFTCNEQGRAMAGYYFAATQHHAMAGSPGGLWTVPHLTGFLAPQEKVREAQAVLDHIIKSIEINPQWAAMQSNITANTSHIVTRTNHEISNIISSTYWNRQAVMDEISRKRSNAILGVEDVIDPLTGERTKVESGANYYWVNHQGTIAGTQTDTRPNLDFRELIRLP